MCNSEIGEYPWEYPNYYLRNYPRDYPKEYHKGHPGDIVNSIYIFYGFSGNQEGDPEFPDGVDKDSSFKLVAQTLADSLKKVYPSSKIYVKQAWTKNKIIEALINAVYPIRQVHIVCHSNSGWLSLAYGFGKFERLKKRAHHFNNMKGTDYDRAIAAMRDEDALITGYFSHKHALGFERLQTIRRNHAKNAYWHIWGCHCGYERCTFKSDSNYGDYFFRFNFGQSSVPGIAIDIAKNISVTVTASRGDTGLTGLSFWHGTESKEVEINDKMTPARKPFWLWNEQGSEWVSYNPAGNRVSRPVIFQRSRNKKELPEGKPPKWLTDLYWRR